MAAPSLIIGLGHRKRVGKDTFAGMLRSELLRKGYVVRTLAFANDMKYLAHSLFERYGLAGPDYYDTYPEQREVRLEDVNRTPRELWIEFGNFMRSIRPDVWIDKVKDRIFGSLLSPQAADLSRPFAFIITDVRYPNEAEAIKSWGGTLVKVNRIDAPYSDDVADNALNDYSGWDWAVGNDLDLDWLQGAAKSFLSYLFSASAGKPWRLG